MQTSKRTSQPNATNRNVIGTSKGGGHSRVTAQFTTTSNVQTDKREVIYIDGVETDVTPLPLIRTEEEKRKEETEHSSKLNSSISEKKEPEISINNSKSEVISEVQSSNFKSMEQSEAFSEFSDDTMKEDEKPEEDQKETAKTAYKLDLDALLEIELSETETQTLFFLPSVAVSAKAENKEDIDRENSDYTQLLKEKAYSDNYQSRPAQTINLMHKAKETITETIKKHEFESEVTEWMLKDSSKEEVKPLNVKEAQRFEQEVHYALNNQLKNTGTLLDPERSLTETHQSLSMSQNNTNTSQKEVAVSRQRQRTDKSSSMLSSSSMNQSQSSSQQPEAEIVPFKPPEDISVPESVISKFNIVERILTQNRYLDQQILYRNYPKVEFQKAIEENKEEEQGMASKLAKIQLEQEKEEENLEEEEEEIDPSKPHMLDLFKYTCTEVEDRNVSCADWNTLNPDLLAVSYGEFDYSSKKEGLLLFWTLKSPKFPEKIIRAPSGILSCHFSKRNPNLIATGCQDGVVAIYDLRTKSDRPVAESSQMLEKHIDSVWEVKWHEQGSEKGENLISVSSDGRIVEWSITKGLECRDLLSLKKPTNPNQKDDKEAAVFRKAVGFSLDFPRGQNLLYLASTEEGTIHKCSLSYSDELDTYWGHSGPVYKVKCNPFWPNIMMSCSADWTVQIWDWRKDETPINTCHSIDLMDSVNDIEWSPHSSTIFSSVADDGRIEVWNLASSIHNPVITYKEATNQASRTMVRFCKEYPVLVSGNSSGVVDVFRLKNLEEKVMTVEEQKSRLEEALGRNKENAKDEEEDEENPTD